jgi:hypothetical protein
MAREEETATAVEVTRGSKGIRLVVMQAQLAQLPTGELACEHCCRDHLLFFVR